jgi:hypothetical protein
MQLRSIVVTFASSAAVAGITLTSGFTAGSAQASPARANAPGQHGGGSWGVVPPGQHGTVSARAAQLAGLADRQAQQGVITGIVDGVAGRPLIGACVAATGPSGTIRTITLADGRYVLAALRPGGYILHFSPCAAGGGYVDQWSGGATWPEHASTVTVAAGQIGQVSRVTLRFTPTAPPAPPISGASGVAFSGLARSGLPGTASPPSTTSPVPAASAGSIAGTVTGNGQPLKGVCVKAFGPSYRFAPTSKTGQYTIGNVRPGRYVVEFIADESCGKNTGNWLTQWYHGVTSPQPPHHPVRVQVIAGKVTRGIDAAMRLGGEITGTTRSRSGKALAGVCVSIQGQLGHIGFGVGVTSGRDGSYVAHSLFQGKYYVEFSPFCGLKGNYVPQWYKDSANQAHARAIEITGTQIVTHIDAALPPGGVISGVVKSKITNAPLGRICVSARPRSYGPGPGPYKATRTAANGSYRLTGLVTGSYVVIFSLGCGNNGNYLPVQRVVPVRTGHTVTADAFLPPGAILTGVVTDAHGNPVQGMCVSASRINPYGAFGDGITLADGSYSIDALPTGAYTVQFIGGCGNAGSYALQYYHGQPNVGSATPVALTAGTTTSGIDTAMQPGATITGVVTGAGHPLNHICVSVNSLSDMAFGLPLDFQFTKNGTYTASNLTPGLYGVNFGCYLSGPHPFGEEWFRSRLTMTAADLVSAAPGVITSDISADLARGGFISGMVTNSAHVKLSDVCVTVVPHGGKIPPTRVPQFLVTDHGTYDFGPISPGRYDVQFADCFSHRYATQWYHGGDTQQAATPVAVHFGATTSGIDAVMTGGGSISGQVTDSAHQPFPRACVTATDAAAQSSYDGETDSTGHYTISHLATGEYQVTFSDCFYGRRVVAGTVVRSVHVTAPHAVLGVNEQLAPAGVISGKVLGGSTATPQAFVCVVAVPVNPADVIGYSVTDEHGQYQLTHLAPGAYQVYFGDPFCLFVGSGYAPKITTPVTVPAGGHVSGVDATLASDGAISGVVTQQPHTPVTGECVTAVPVNPTPDPLFGSTLHDAVAVTAADGSYTLVGLLPGQYKVEFSTGCGDSGFGTQWWNNAGSAATATTITVSASATVQKIDATLQP